MSTEGLTPVVVDQYGGLCTLIDRSDLPVGLSPDCQNVEFFPGGVRSRKGFVVHEAIGFDGCDLLSHTTPAGYRTLLVLCSSGEIVGGGVESAPAVIPFSVFAASTTALGFDLRMRGTSMFGRAYFGLYGGWDTRTAVAEYAPVTGPFQYDGTSITPVTQAGPPGSFTVANTGGGIIGMSAGRHDFVVVYETATGYVTFPSPPVGDTFTAGDYAALASVPVGPGAIAKRIVFATPANSTSFFSLPRFAINDNTTTTINLDFSDAELISGTSLEDYLDRPRIPPVMGVEKYGQRLVYWGGYNRIQPFFDGDATSPPQPIVVGLTALDFDEQDGAIPSPWVVTGTGGSVGTQAGAALQVYRITGNGITASRGQIDQVAANVGLSGTYYIGAQKTYNFRYRVRRNALLTNAGVLSITLRGSTTNVAGSGTVLASSSLSYATLIDTQWIRLEGAPVLVTANYPYVNMTIVATGNPTANGTFEIDYVEVFDTSDPTSRSVLWVSDPGSPESVNLATGVVPVAENDGQDILNVFELRGNLYVCKEHSLYVVTDDGNEPADWSVDQVSDVVGTVSPHGVALGDGWATIVDRDGLYYFTGGMPEKISQEIQPTWDALDWGWAIKAWVTVDPGDKRVYLYVPAGAAGSRIGVLDYTEGFGDPISSVGTGRKWTQWLIGSSASVVAGVMAERWTRDASFFVVSGVNIILQSATYVSDYGTVPIVSHYQTAPLGMEIGRALYDRLIVRARGVGSLLAYWISPGGTQTALPTKTLAASPDDDIEIKFRAQQTQVGFGIGTSALTDYWSCRRLAVFFRPSEFSYLRKT